MKSDFVISGEEDDEEPYESRSGDEEDMEPMTSMTGSNDMASGGQSVDVSNLPPVQRDLYRRIQQHQQFPQNTSSQTSNNNGQQLKLCKCSYFQCNELGICICY